MLFCFEQLWALLRPHSRQSKLTHSAEAEVIYQILAGASLLKSFHLRGRL